MPCCAASGFAASELLLWSGTSNRGAAWVWFAEAEGFFILDIWALICFLSELNFLQKVKAAARAATVMKDKTPNATFIAVMLAMDGGVPHDGLPDELGLGLLR